MSSPTEVGAQVVKTMASMSKALDTSRKQVLRDIGKRARADLRAAATQVPGGDRRFSNMSKYSHGGRLDVTFNVRADLVFIGSKGPWKIAEQGAAPHGHHPGTARSQGRSSWSRAADPVLASAAGEVPKVIGDAVEEAFNRG